MAHVKKRQGIPCRAFLTKLPPHLLFLNEDKGMQGESVLGPFFSVFFFVIVGFYVFAKTILRKINR